MLDNLCEEIVGLCKLCAPVYGSSVAKRSVALRALADMRRKYGILGEVIFLCPGVGTTFQPSDYNYELWLSACVHIHKG